MLGTSCSQTIEIASSPRVKHAARNDPVGWAADCNHQLSRSLPGPAICSKSTASFLLWQAFSYGL